MTQAILKEVDSVKSFFSSRADSDSGTEALAKNFTNALIQQINSCLSLPTCDASMLVQALKDSPYGDANITRIIAAIDAKVMANSTAAKAATGPKDQVLKEWWNMCTQDDWDCFKDPKRSFHSKMTRLVERGNLLGCTNPDEQTLKWMLAMLLMSHYLDMPGPSDIYDKLQELKQVVVCERKPYPLEQLTNFPSRPEDLPKEVYAYAYTDSKPTAVVLPGIKSIAIKAIPLRSNSKLLKQKSPPADKFGKLNHAAQPVITIDGGEWLEGAGQFNLLQDIPEELWDQLEAMVKAKRNKS